MLASIVEKETGRPTSVRVAAVFINRLKHKMRLQSIRPSFTVCGGKGTVGRLILKQGRTDDALRTPI